MRQPISATICKIFMIFSCYSAIIERPESIGQWEKTQTEASEGVHKQTEQGQKRCNVAQR